MTTTTVNIKTVQLREDAKDIKIEYLAGNQFTGISTYIMYISESHPHKHCVYVVFGKYEQVSDTKVINGKIQLIEMF
jgi:hypothetical protein